MTDERTPEQRKQDDADAKQSFNELLHRQPNKVTATRDMTLQQFNAALRKAAGRDDETDGGDAA
jgi:hypothetical protein